jgi:hypothetical protein
MPSTWRTCSLRLDDEFPSTANDRKLNATETLFHRFGRRFNDTCDMRRLLAFLLAFALLFQTTWAVAATYCEHETSPKAAMHFGHHAHIHKSSDAKKPVSNMFAVDDDCGYCHASHAAIMPMAPAGIAPEATRSVEFSRPVMHSSAPARAPDRPQWLRLA